MNGALLDPTIAPWGAIDAVRQGLALLFCALGGVMALAGALGVLRFPDVFTRVHAAALIPTLATATAGLGLALAAWDAAFGIRLFLLWMALALVWPATAHFLISGAHGAGLQPMIGRWTSSRAEANRPGSKGAAR
jgi:multicomponent Na+:H+ antiporter subunit G